MRRLLRGEWRLEMTNGQYAFIAAAEVALLVVILLCAGGVL